MSASDPPLPGVAPAAVAFDASEAWARNLGWVSAAEQRRLRASRVAIAGLGGVGGAHLLTLVRLGVGAFHLADPDVFELANFNRQAGALVSTLGRSKLEVLADMARDIDPELALRLFPEGVSPGNVEDFLDGVDLYVDGLDFFAFEARAAVFAACARRGIPAITVAPLGMGAALLNFVPGGMSFESYFRWDGCDDTGKALRFLAGLAPSLLHASYLVDPSAVDLAARRGPSTVMACQLCAGIAGTEALKLLLGRGPVLAAPRGVHFDAYRQRLRVTWRPGGNAHPLQRALIALARRRYPGALEDSAPRSGAAGTTPEALPNLLMAAPPGGAPPPWPALLEAARWAPSGDNTQPWRFEVLDERRAVLHGFDTRHWCVYDIDGWPSRLAIGGLLETLRIAAAALAGRQLVWRLMDDSGGPALRIELVLTSAGPAAEPAGSGLPDDAALAAVIARRSVQRRALSMRRLSHDDRQAIEAAVARAGDFACVWFESLHERLVLARLLSASTRIRLRLAAAWRTHARVIEWGARFSTDRIPDRAIGLDGATLRLMRWVMAREARALSFARGPGATLWPRLWLDLWPATACAAHLAIVRRDAAAPDATDDFALGAAMQRAWLTAEARGLRLQPEMALPIFAQYGARDAACLGDSQAEARRLALRWHALPGIAGRHWGIWLCRLGYGPAAVARSLRRPIEISANRQADPPGSNFRKEFP
jgi:molybdopterin/thiamine biosynthesis adenylyltransferase